MPPLEGRGLTRGFGDFVAVRSADIEVEEGEVVGLIGANGAGKTTLIRMLLGLVTPTEGEALMFGEPPSLATRRRVGYVPQGLGLYEDLTVTENLEFAAAAFGHEPFDLDGELSRARNRLVRDLSLGLQRRIAFAIALGHEPDLLVLDEPTSGVGAVGRIRLWDDIRRTAEKGAGILVTTHHMSEAEQCDRLLVMVQGEVVARGSASEIVGGAFVVEARSPRWEKVIEILDDTGLLVALVGSAVRVPDANLSDVAALLDDAGIDAHVELVPASFEERFVSLAHATG
ncbi:ABC transporter ATP-binding protein [soil metagenome]